MKQSIHHVLLAVLSCLLFSACNKDEEQEFVMSQSPIGKTYYANDITIKFESADTVSFFIVEKDNPETSKYKGKAKYIFNNGDIEIRNADNKDLSVSEVLNTKYPYFLYFHGKFASPDILTAKFNLYGYQYQMLTLCDIDFHTINK